LLASFLLGLFPAVSACGGTHGVGSSAGTTSGSSSSGGTGPCGSTPGGTSFFPWPADVGDPTGPIVVDDKNLYLYGLTEVPVSHPADLQPLANVVQIDKGGTACPVVLGSMLGLAPRDLAVSATDVYWTVSGFLSRTPIGGGTTTAIRPIDLVNGMAIDATALYWATYTGGDVISEMPLPGGTATILVTTTDGRGSWSLAAAGGGVFYNYGTSDPSDTMSEIRRVAAGGGPSVTIASSQNDAASVAVDAAHVYWANAGESILAAPQQGGAATVLASGLKKAAGLVVDGATLYFSADGGIYKMPVSGGTPGLVAAATTASFAVDATRVYWTDGSTGGVFRGPK
jgi:hypothetical protein